MKTRMFFSLLLVALLVLVVCGTQAWGKKDDPQGNVKQVNCSKGQTITRALEESDGNPITIQVKGTCDDNVEIVRDDVTLIADPSGGTIDGPDPNKNTIGVKAARTVIDGLTVTGGRSGISVTGSGGATIRNCTVRNTGRNGIVFYQGGRGTVDQCMVQNNLGHGIYIEAASATVINSTISSNDVGIDLGQGGNARIGITDIGEYAGNTISDNYGSGIFIYGGGSAYIGGNTINRNGLATNPVFGNYGVWVTSATAILVGNNLITGNGGCGVLAMNSNVRFGERGFGLPTHNTITGNGIGPSAILPKSGIYGQQGTFFSIVDADISNNTGHGIFLSGCSIASFPFGGGPVATVTGNSLFGLRCNDASKCSKFGGNISGITGNTAGDVGEFCTEF